MAVTACHSYDLLAAPHQERNLSWRFFVLLQWLKSWNWNIFLERTQPFKPAHASVSSTSFEPRAFDELRSLQSWGHEPWMYVWIAPVCMYNDVYLLDVNITKNCMSAQCIWTWQDRGVPVPGFGVFQFYLSTRTSSNSKKPWGGSFSSWPILGLYLHRVKTSKDRPSRAPREAEWKEYRAAALQRSSWICRHKLHTCRTRKAAFRSFSECAKQQVAFWQSLPQCLENSFHASCIANAT